MAKPTERKPEQESTGNNGTDQHERPAAEGEPYDAAAIKKDSRELHKPARESIASNHTYESCAGATAQTSTTEQHKPARESTNQPETPAAEGEPYEAAAIKLEYDKASELAVVQAPLALTEAQRQALEKEEELKRNRQALDELYKMKELEKVLFEAVAKSLFAFYSSFEIDRFST